MPIEGSRVGGDRVEIAGEPERRAPREVGPVAVGVTGTRSGRILNAQTPVQLARVRVRRVRSVLGHNSDAVAGSGDSGTVVGRAGDSGTFVGSAIERSAVVGSSIERSSF